MKQMGTILPTKESMAIADRLYKKEMAKREQIGDKELSQYPKQVVFGETRYYKNDTTFAIVGRNNKIKWFEIRNGQEYALNRKGK